MWVRTLESRLVRFTGLPVSMRMWPTAEAFRSKQRPAMSFSPAAPESTRTAAQATTMGPALYRPAAFRSRRVAPSTRGAIFFFGEGFLSGFSQDKAGAAKTRIILGKFFFSKHHTHI